jgi:hypothetical protein
MSEDQKKKIENQGTITEIEKGTKSPKAKPVADGNKPAKVCNMGNGIVREDF